MNAASQALLKTVVETLRTIYDPELPVNIYDLGLIYRLEVHPECGRVDIDMTLTAPACPVAERFPGQVAAAVRQLAGVDEVVVNLVWEPRWTRNRMSEAARLELGILPRRKTS